MNGQMIMLINYGGSNVNFKKENGNNHEYIKIVMATMYLL